MPPHMNMANRRQLQTDLATVATGQYQQLKTRLEQALIQLSHQPMAFDDGTKRVLIASLSPEQDVISTAHGLEQAGLSMPDIKISCSVPDQPGQIHPAALAEEIIRFQPTRLILLNQFRQHLGNLADRLPSSVSWCLWHQPLADSVLETWKPLQKPERIFVSSPSTTQQLNQLNHATWHIETLGPAADQEIFRPLTLDEEQRRQYGGDVAIVMDPAAIEPQAVGIKWESHQRLWKKIADSLRDKPQRLNFQTADQLIERVSRQMKIPLDTGNLRDAIVRYMYQYLAPTMTGIALINELTRHQINIRCWGSRWKNLLKSTDISIEPTPTPTQRNLIYNAAPCHSLSG